MKIETVEKRIAEINLTLTPEEARIIRMVVGGHTDEAELAAARRAVDYRSDTDTPYAVKTVMNALYRQLELVAPAGVL